MVLPPSGGAAALRCLLLLFDVYVLGVDYAFVFLGFGWGGIRTGRWAGSGRVGFVEDLGQLVAGVGQLLVRGLEFSRCWRAFEHLLGLGQGRLDLGLVGSLHLLAAVFQH